VDLVVDDRVIVELKSVEHLARAHAKPLLTYLKLAKLPVGLLISFGAPTLREGLRRIGNGFQPSASSRLRVNQRCVRSRGATVTGRRVYHQRLSCRICSRLPTHFPEDPSFLTERQIATGGRAANALGP
jgi:ribosomal protein L34